MFEEYHQPLFGSSLIVILCRMQDAPDPLRGSTVPSLTTMGWLIWSISMWVGVVSGVGRSMTCKNRLFVQNVLSSVRALMGCDISGLAMVWVS